MYARWVKLRSFNPNVVVCSADRAEDHLRHTRHGSGKKVDALISLASPEGSVQGRQRPSHVAAAVAPRRLYLTFDDATGPTWADDISRWVPSEQLPTKEDVDKLLKFGAGLHHFSTTLDLPTRVVVHCYAGQSRSTAAALMLFAQGLRDRSDTEILRAFTSCCEETRCNPNGLMMKLADEALGFGGRLLDLAAQLHSSQASMY